MPLISIVMPTHRRPHLLQTALKSALEQQDFSDYEVLVCDNSADQSAAETVARFSDARVRYLTTGTDLDIYGSWNYAVERAAGRYTFLFADDDALLPNGLATIRDALTRYRMPEFLGLVSGWYTRPGFKRGPGNAVRFEDSWNREGAFQPEQLLREYFMFGRPSFSATYLLIDQPVREALKQRGVPIYLPLFPDYALQGAALAVAKSAAVMSEPTLLHGYAAESLGEQYCYPRKKLEWPAPAGEEKVFKFSPVSGYTFQNGRLETMLRVQEALPEVAHLPIDVATFLQLYGRELVVEGTWRDVTQNAAELMAYLETLEEPGRTQVFAKLRPLLVQLLGVVELRAWEVLHDLQDDWMNGDDHQFADINEAAQRAGALIRRRQQRSRIHELLNRASRSGVTPHELLRQDGEQSGVAP